MEINLRALTFTSCLSGTFFVNTKLELLETRITLWGLQRSLLEAWLEVI